MYLQRDSDETRHHTISIIVPFAELRISPSAGSGHALMEFGAEVASQAVGWPDEPLQPKV
jgi:hypothetical protein